MNKLILFSICTFMHTQIILSQWTRQESPTDKTLKHIYAVDENVLWVCGFDGVVLKSTNGGDIWIETKTDTAYNNIAVAAIDSAVAWVTGTKYTKNEAKIWKTTDGGNTWTEQWYGSPAYSNSMTFLDSLNGVAFLDYAAPSSEWLILTTSDGGITWHKVPAANMPAVDSANAELGLEGSLANKGNSVWFSSYSQTEARIYYSTDKGINWNRTAQLLFTEPERSLYIVPVSEINLIALGGAGLPGFSHDGGINWNFPRPTSIGLFATGISRIPGTSTLIAVGLLGRSMVSQDYGINWRRLETTADATDLRSIAAVTHTKAWTVGSKGYIYKWTGPPMPVELTSFQIKSSSGKVFLEWSTATEINNKGFEIERKEDAGNWRVIHYMNGNSTTSDISKYTYTDDVSGLNAKSISYRLKQIDFNGTFTYSGEQSVNVSSPRDLVLNQNYPNPFNPMTMIEYGIPFESYVKISVYDALGQAVSELVNQVQTAGFYEVIWNAGSISTGTYFYVIKAVPLNGEKEFTSIKKMILVK